MPENVFHGTLKGLDKLGNKQKLYPKTTAADILLNDIDDTTSDTIINNSNIPSNASNLAQLLNSLGDTAFKNTSDIFIPKSIGISNGERITSSCLTLLGENGKSIKSSDIFTNNFIVLWEGLIEITIPDDGSNSTEFIHFNIPSSLHEKKYLDEITTGNKPVTLLINGYDGNSSNDIILTLGGKELYNNPYGSNTYVIDTVSSVGNFCMYFYNIVSTDAYSYNLYLQKNPIQPGNGYYKTITRISAFVENPMQGEIK